MAHAIKKPAAEARAAVPCAALSSRDRYRQHANVAELTPTRRDPLHLVQWVCMACLVMTPLLLSLEGAPA